MIMIIIIMIIIVIIIIGKGRFHEKKSNYGNDNNVNNDYWQGPGGEEDEAGWTGQH